jgi:hypothetical protein
LSWSEGKEYSCDPEILFLLPIVCLSFEKSIDNLKCDTKVNLN